MAKESQLIQIKGLRDGLMIMLGDAEWSELYALLFKQIDERQSFFQGARLALDVGNQGLRVAELSGLRDELSERSISLWAVISTSPSTVQTAQLLGLATRISKPREIKAPHSVPEVTGEKSALWVERTLRSGTRVESDGNVVVMGDVNPGAEIVAVGNVLIWGRLRGSVHAGAGGDARAFVCTLKMSATRLQIADEILNPSKEKKNAFPEKIFLKDGRFVREFWKNNTKSNR